MIPLAIEVEVWQVVVIPLVLALIGFGTALLARGVNKEGNAIQFSRDLVARVDKLDEKIAGQDIIITTQGAEIARVRGALEASMRYSDALAVWGASGGRGPKPSPPWELQEFRRIEQAEHTRVD